MGSFPLDDLLRSIPTAEILRTLDNKESVRAYITARLQSLGLQPILMPFRTELGAGVNVIVDIGSTSKGPSRLLGAHLDGNELHDNLGGVLALLDIAALFRDRATSHRWRLGFWDAEERFQQGSGAYLKHLGKSCGSTGYSDVHEIYLDVDGLGLGSNLLLRPVSDYYSSALTEPADKVFLMDSDVFCSAGIPSYHLFSGTKSFESAYRLDGLNGCYRAIAAEGLDTYHNWRSAMPDCLKGLRHLVSAWEALPFHAAALREQITWLIRE